MKPYSTKPLMARLGRCLIVFFVVCGLLNAAQAASYEAETLMLEGFHIETQAEASGRQVIALDGDSGTARMTIRQSGTYDIETQYFDENDGAAVYKIFLDNHLMDAWSAHRNLCDATPGSGNRVVHYSLNVPVKVGQKFELLAYRDVNEPCRVDNISLNPSPVKPSQHSMTWNADGTIASLRLRGVEHLSGESGHAAFRQFDGDSLETLNLSEATTQNGITEVINGSRKMIFRVDEFEHHLLFRLIGFEGVDRYDETLSARLSMGLSQPVHVVTLDDQAKAIVSDASIEMDWVKLFNRNRFPGGVFALFADGTPGENDAAVHEILDLHGGAPVAEDITVVTGAGVPASIMLPSLGVASTAYSYHYTQPSHGLLTGIGPELIYTSQAEATRDRFTYSMSYDGLNSETKTVNIILIGSHSLVAHWPLDDNAGTVASDASGHGFDGNISGGVWVSGQNNGALEFNGSDTVVLPPKLFNVISDEITIAMWANGDSDQQPQHRDSVFYAADSSGDRFLNIHLPWKDSKVYWDAGNGSDYNRISKTAKASDYEGQWNHWVFTKDSNAGIMKIYLNGSLWHSGSGATIPMDGVVAQARLGSGIDDTYYEGSLDDVRLYNYALTQAEISTLYTLGGGGRQ